MNASRAGWAIIDDVPWYVVRGRRARGQWAICVTCGAEMPELPSRPRTICQRTCLRKPTRARADSFTEWTAAECWLAGLLWADGSICAKGSARLCTTDQEMAEAAAEILALPAPAASPSRGGRKPTYYLGFGGEPVRRLEAVGLSRQKTAHCLFPALPPGASMPAFVRGFFDGDGSVGLYVNPSKKVDRTPRLKSSVVGTKEFLTGLQEVLVRDAGVRKNKVCRHSGCRAEVYNLWFGHADSLKLAAYIYSAPGPALTRKKRIFDEGDVRGCS